MAASDLMSKADDEPKPNVLAHALEEQRQTEDLLAAFDRPGRTPKTSSVRRDFVEYFDKRPAKTAPFVSPRPPSPVPPKKRRDVATFVIPRKGSHSAIWVLWGILLIAMPVIGGVVAYFALFEKPASTAPSTSNAPNLVRGRNTAADRARVPSGSSSPLVLDGPAAAPPSATRPPGSASAASAKSAGPREAPSPSGSADPRVDFVRDL